MHPSGRSSHRLDAVAIGDLLGSEFPVNAHQRGPDGVRDDAAGNYVAVWQGAISMGGKLTIFICSDSTSTARP
jgi:hypothetical protein